MLGVRTCFVTSTPASRPTAPLVVAAWSPSVTARIVSTRCLTYARWIWSAPTSFLGPNCLLDLGVRLVNVGSRWCWVHSGVLATVHPPRTLHTPFPRPLQLLCVGVPLVPSSKPSKLFAVQVTPVGIDVHPTSHRIAEPKQTRFERPM